MVHLVARPRLEHLQHAEGRAGRAAHAHRRRRPPRATKPERAPSGRNRWSMDAAAIGRRGSDRPRSIQPPTAASVRIRAMAPIPMAARSAGAGPGSWRCTPRPGPPRSRRPSRGAPGDCGCRRRRYSARPSPEERQFDGEGEGNAVPEAEAELGAVVAGQREVGHVHHEVEEPVRCDGECHDQRRPAVPAGVPGGPGVPGDGGGGGPEAGGQQAVRDRVVHELQRCGGGPAGVDAGPAPRPSRIVAPQAMSTSCIAMKRVPSDSFGSARLSANAIP